jgi:hypothetical protein
MLVSFPLVAARRAVAQAIAASGVSDHDHDSDLGGDFVVASVRVGRTVIWRSPEPVGSPYVPPHSQAGCPECGTRVVRAGGCLGCPACGWGKCG